MQGAVQREKASEGGQDLRGSRRTPRTARSGIPPTKAQWDRGGASNQQVASLAQKGTFYINVPFGLHSLNDKMQCTVAFKYELHCKY